MIEDINPIRSKRERKAINKGKKILKKYKVKRLKFEEESGEVLRLGEIYKNKARPMRVTYRSRVITEELLGRTF